MLLNRQIVRSPGRLGRLSHCKRSYSRKPVSSRSTNSVCAVDSMSKTPIFRATPNLGGAITIMNSTNLAMKGILGIGAMARISDSMGHSDDAKKYRVRSSSYRSSSGCSNGFTGRVPRSRTLLNGRAWRCRLITRTFDSATTATLPRGWYIHYILTCCSIWALYLILWVAATTRSLGWVT